MNVSLKKISATKRMNRSLSLRMSLIVTGMGLLTFLPLYVWIYRLQSLGESPAALRMPSTHMENMSTFWSFPILQASGLAGLIWSYIGVLLGLMISARSLAWLPLNKGQINRLHRQISLLVIGFILVHALATSFDAMGGSIITSFIPWQAYWKAATFAYNLGIFAMYFAILFGPTYYLRNWLGTRIWLYAHRLTLLIYILSIWHTLILGADVSFYSWIRPFIWIIQIPLLLLLIRRLVRPSRTGKKQSHYIWIWSVTIRYGLAVLSGIAIAAIVIIVATGNSDFIKVI